MLDGFVDVYLDGFGEGDILLAQPGVLHLGSSIDLL